MPVKEGDNPIRCPICRRKLMPHLQFGIGRIFCRWCKQEFRIDRKPMVNVI